MTDFCVVCCDATPREDDGDYVEFESESGIEISRFVCAECSEDGDQP